MHATAHTADLLAALLDMRYLQKRINECVKVIAERLATAQEIFFIRRARPVGDATAVIAGAGGF